MPAPSLSMRTTSSYSSCECPNTLQKKTMFLMLFRSGSFSSRKARTPTFCSPMALSMPAAVSNSRGGGLPAIGSRESPFTTNPPSRSSVTTSSNSTPSAPGKVPSPQNPPTDQTGQRPQIPRHRLAGKSLHHEPAQPIKRDHVLKFHAIAKTSTGGHHRVLERNSGNVDAHIQR